MDKDNKQSPAEQELLNINPHLIIDTLSFIPFRKVQNYFQKQTDFLTIYYFILDQSSWLYSHFYLEEVTLLWWTQGLRIRTKKPPC